MRVAFRFQVFYLIFCRSVWYFPLRLDCHLYVQVLFNQIAPDYLEGLLLVLPNEQLPEELVVSAFQIYTYNSNNKMSTFLKNNFVKRNVKILLKSVKNDFMAYL